MNFLTAYYQPHSDTQLSISAAQGSAFAKQQAGDYNPIHNPQSKRFCVPGDLLFAIALERYGCSAQMEFSFLELVSGDAMLTYPKVANTQNRIIVNDDKDKQIMQIQRSGAQLTAAASLQQLAKNYVAFSGYNFPHVLVPLMRSHAVMINPQRPLVIYQSMSLQFTEQALQTTPLDFTITLQNTVLQVQGRRGQVSLDFSIKSADKLIGKGSKQLVLGGLRDYDHAAMSELSDNYLANKTLNAK